MTAPAAVLETAPPGLEGTPFRELLQESVRLHGHLCPGQVLGVRLAVHGLRLIGLTDPKGRHHKRLYLFVETDRCATDALQSVTGCSLGHRTMKLMDYGKMAATFADLATGAAVRVYARDEARGEADRCFPGTEGKYIRQIEAYKVLTDETLFESFPVQVAIPTEDLPGRPLSRVRCEACGEHVQDSREVRSGCRILCRPCASSGYYRLPLPKAGTR